MVLGSAVYVGRWMEPARDYATAHLTVLRSKAVWLLSSGPIGEPPFPPDEPHDVGALTAMLTPRGHRSSRADWTSRCSRSGSAPW